jgi:hypothetical protein
VGLNVNSYSQFSRSSLREPLRTCHSSAQARVSQRQFMSITVCRLFRKTQQMPPPHHKVLYVYRLSQSSSPTNLSITGYDSGSNTSQPSNTAPTGTNVFTLESLLKNSFHPPSSSTRTRTPVHLLPHSPNTTPSSHHG